MKKIAIVYGASGMLGSHLTLDFAKHGYCVKAITRLSNVVTKELDYYCETKDKVDNEELHSADIVVDCRSRATRYGTDSFTDMSLDDVIGSKTVSLSTTALFCEQAKLGIGITNTYIDDSFHKEELAKNRGCSVLRLPVMTIEGHYLPKSVLSLSGRIGLDYNLLRAKQNDSFILTEHYLSVREYLPIIKLLDWVLLATKHKLCYASLGSPKTLKEQVYYLLENGIVDKDLSYAKNIVFTDHGKISNHHHNPTAFHNVAGL